jgi:hypothetical protein
VDIVRLGRVVASLFREKLNAGRILNVVDACLRLRRPVAGTGIAHIHKPATDAVARA